VAGLYVGNVGAKKYRAASSVVELLQAQLDQFQGMQTTSRQCCQQESQ